MCFWAGIMILGGLSLFVIFVFIGGANPYRQNLMNTFAVPSSSNFLGTDHLGRDIASRSARGALNSIMYASVSVLASMIIGTVVGMSSAWAGGKIDELLLSITDFAQAFPNLLFALFIGGLFKLGAWPIVVSIVLTGWSEYCRLSRAMTRIVLAQPYVEAGIVSGFPVSFLLVKYILPEITGQIMNVAMLSIAKTVLYISSLNFVGIGLSPPIPELGAMVSESLPYIRRHPFVIVPPSMMISLFVFALVLISISERARSDNGSQGRLG
jgi:ABC-type dipeptide/oligopeptide/nickel transport system permease subunit